MSYQTSGFNKYFLETLKAKQSSLNSYNVNLRKVDDWLGGLDEHLAAHSGEQLIQRMLAENAFAPYASNVRSAVRTYMRFLEAADAVPELADVEEGPSAQESQATIFKYENELQAAVRKQLGELEAGLTEADDGAEMVLSTGRPDIVARDPQGRLVAIELKAGACPRGALEQALGYAADLDELEPESKSRVIVVASDFSPRQRAAARRIPDLQLKSYRLSVDFVGVS